jgi:hypothetical protein
MKSRESVRAREREGGKAMKSRESVRAREREGGKSRLDRFQS